METDIYVNDGQNIETKLDQVLVVSNQKYDSRLEEKELELVR